jgi:hypothetical protein
LDTCGKEAHLGCLPQFTQDRFPLTVYFDSFPDLFLNRYDPGPELRKLVDRVDLVVPVVHELPQQSFYSILGLQVGHLGEK